MQKPTEKAWRVVREPKRDSRASRTNGKMRPPTEVPV
jgi:hypothetical protein